MGCEHWGTRGKRSWELKERGFFGKSVLGSRREDYPSSARSRFGIHPSSRRIKPTWKGFAQLKRHFPPTFFDLITLFIRNQHFEAPSRCHRPHSPKRLQNSFFFHFVFEHRAKFGGAELPPAAEQLNLEAPKELLQDGKFYTRKSGH